MNKLIKQDGKVISIIGGNFIKSEVLEPAGLKV